MYLNEQRKNIMLKMKYSRDDILQMLISQYHFQTEFDPVVIKRKKEVFFINHKRHIPLNVLMV